MKSTAPFFLRSWGASGLRASQGMMRRKSPCAHLSYPPDLIALIAEAQPLLSRPWETSLLASVRTLSVGLLLLPFALVQDPESVKRDVGENLLRAAAQRIGADAELRALAGVGAQVPR